MPSQSIIVGVDLAPIKPIPRVITFQSDITTDKCRATIRQHLKHWKADSVLHDGAPNVGTAWIQDAFSQAELVLQSLKLATEFLIEGGAFVTKIFRSKDYNPLLWVFKQLFTSVEATKPPSSRNVSAEIFVVCRGYKAPKRIDPKFLDSRHVFAELADPTPNNEAKVFNPEKKKRKREGYEEGNYTQFKEIPVTEFVNTSDPIAILGSYNKLSFQQPPAGDIALATLERLEETTDEIRTCCEDLKLLGKKEFRHLLRWRLKIREKFGLIVRKGQSKGKEEGKEVAEVARMDDELAIQEDLHRLRERESARSKKERKKENERKRKDIVRMQMHMTTPMDIGMEQLGPSGDDMAFSIKPIDRQGARDTIASGKQATFESESDGEKSESEEDESDVEGDRLESELDMMYQQYQERKEEQDSKLRAKKARKYYETDEWDGFSNSGEDETSDEGEEGDSAGLALASESAPRSANLSSQASLFFDQDIFQGLLDENGTEDEEDDGGEHRNHTAGPRETTKNAKSEQHSADSSDEEEPREDPRNNNGKLGESLL